jgi:hypothetical protein
MNEIDDFCQVMEGNEMFCDQKISNMFLSFPHFHAFILPFWIQQIVKNTCIPHIDLPQNAKSCSNLLHALIDNT